MSKKKKVDCCSKDTATILANQNTMMESLTTLVKSMGTVEKSVLDMLKQAKAGRF